MDPMSSVNKVELQDISKSFGGISALKQVTFRVKPGEIHALMGENGAGKSTLMKILSGAYQKDSGTIRIDGNEVQIRNTHDSKDLGIGIIYQEFSLVPELTVAENIFLSQLNSYGFWVNWDKMRKDADALIRSIGFEIKASAKVSRLSVAQQQIVEIAKALAREVSVLILDEPSAVLGYHEITKLFRTLEELKKKGVAIIYISHRLEEIFQIADRVTVLRNGASSESLDVADTTKDEIIKMMLGRSLNAMFPPHESKIGQELLKVDNVTIAGKVRGVSFSVHAGEIVGIAGLVGSGRTETLQAVFSSRKRQGGRLFLAQKEIRPSSPRQAVRAGIGMVPEDRKSEGLIVTLPIRDNISLTNLKRISGRTGFISRGKEIRRTGELMQTLKVKASDGGMPANKLSGGNQQKVVMAKWLNVDCSVMLIDEPTRGVDVGAKVEIYNEIYRMADKGIGVVVVSSDTAELLGIADRILVMHEGSITGELARSEFSEENVLRLAINEQASPPDDRGPGAPENKKT